jgi:hypothetical protein
MNDQTQAQMVQAWAEILVLKWKDQIQKLGIGVSNQLIDSIILDIQFKAPDIASEVRLRFNYYGKFVDMGVGRGQKKGEKPVKLKKKVGKTSTRKAKPWYSPIFWAEFNKLVAFLTEKGAADGALIIRENWEDNSISLKSFRTI